MGLHGIPTKLVGISGKCKNGGMEGWNGEKQGPRMSHFVPFGENLLTITPAEGVDGVFTCQIAGGTHEKRESAG